MTRPITNTHIDETAYTRAIQPLNFAHGEKQPGGHAWARSLVTGYEHSITADEDIIRDHIKRAIAGFGIPAAFEGFAINSIMNTIRPYLRRAR